MDIALINGERSTPSPGARGSCQYCGRDMVAKCGPRIRHHWAHARRLACDPWWENETEWHRAWKGQFPEETRERLHFADDGEIHIADVKTPTGIVLEFQHSRMTDEERRSREAFYSNMIWVVDAAGFKRNFHLLHWLPERSTDFTRDLVWFPRKWHHDSAHREGLFWRLSDNPGVTPRQLEPGQLVMVCTDWAIREHPDLKNVSHRMYDWVRPRQTWLESTVPVYLDFGDDILWRLDTYDEWGLRAIFPVHRRKFLHDVMTETQAKDVGTRGYPIDR